MYAVGEFTSAGPPADGWVPPVSALHGALGMESRDPRCFRGRTDWQRSAAFTVVRWRSDPARLTRGPRQVRDDPRPTYGVVLPVRGALRVDACGRAVDLRPRRLGSVAMDEPFALTHATGTAVAFAVPADRIGGRLGPHPAGTVDARRGVGRLAGVLLQSLHDERSAVDDTTFDATCERILDLLCLAASGAPDAGTEPHRGGIEAAVRRHVREHADDVALDGRAVAAALGRSLRYVQAALQAAGTTPSEVIRRERVRLARTVLDDPA